MPGLTSLAGVLTVASKSSSWPAQQIKRGIGRVRAGNPITAGDVGCLLLERHVVRLLRAKPGGNGSTRKSISSGFTAGIAYPVALAGKGQTKFLQRICSTIAVSIQCIDTILYPTPAVIAAQCCLEGV